MCFMVASLFCKVRPWNISTLLEHKNAVFKLPIIRKVERQKKTGNVEALDLGADILIVERYVTENREIERSVRDPLKLTTPMREDIDLYRVHTE